jgi:hypothetical protein
VAPGRGGEGRRARHGAHGRRLGRRGAQRDDRAERVILVRALDVVPDRIEVDRGQGDLLVLAWPQRPVGHRGRAVRREQHEAVHVARVVHVPEHGTRQLRDLLQRRHQVALGLRGSRRRRVDEVAGRGRRVRVHRDAGVPPIGHRLQACLDHGAGVRDLGEHLRLEERHLHAAPRQRDRPHLAEALAVDDEPGDEAFSQRPIVRLARLHAPRHDRHFDPPPAPDVERGRVEERGARVERGIGAERRERQVPDLAPHRGGERERVVVDRLRDLGRVEEVLRRCPVDRERADVQPAYVRCRRIPVRICRLEAVVRDAVALRRAALAAGECSRGRRHPSAPQAGHISTASPPRYSLPRWTPPPLFPKETVWCTPSSAYPEWSAATP